MSILTLFVVIPVVMLLGLWLARNDNQVRGVMVCGASALLALAIYLTVAFIQQRSLGNDAAMLWTYSTSSCCCSSRFRMCKPYQHYLLSQR